MEGIEKCLNRVVCGYPHTTLIFKAQYNYMPA